MRKMRSIFFSRLLCSAAWAVFSLSFSGDALALEDAPRDGVAGKEISADILWKGEITVNGKVTVLTGATLTIAPRTTVRFAEGAGLLVKGRIIAEGEPDGIITFTSLGRKEPSSWDEISLESATGSRFVHCIFEYATWGLHGHFTQFLVKDSRFRSNHGGIRFMSGFAEIRHSVFDDNHVGVRWRAGNGLIEENVITRNEFGCFIKEKGGKLTIRNNDIFANKGYNIRVGDFVDMDVNAESNWWGPGDPIEKIYDGRREPGLGKVHYEPFLREPVRPAFHEGL